MSRDVAISLEFKHEIDFEAVLDRLARADWEFFREENAVWYMTDFDWKDLPRDSFAEAKSEIRLSYEQGNVVGITARLSDRETFANLLFHEERTIVSLIPLPEYHFIAHMPEFVDLGWYAERLLVPCRSLPIVRIEASDQR